MSKAYTWAEFILSSDSPKAIWAKVFSTLLEIASESSIDEVVNRLNRHTRAADRFLSEAAWELWQRFPEAAPRTSSVLRDWWQQPTSHGKATLILDALSLRELPALLAGASQREIVPDQVRVTGAEAPSDTDKFAQALGIASRSKLALNKTPGTFSLGQETYTEVLGIPFADSISSIPTVPNVFIWHTWLDDLIHLHHRPPKQIYKDGPNVLQDDGFWQLVNKMRQGRKLVITADHGYAESNRFHEEEDDEVTKSLRGMLGASRYKKATETWPHQFMPPVVKSTNTHLIAMGQRKWRVQGGFPALCHGGLSLLEVAVPFVELPPV